VTDSQLDRLRAAYDAYNRGEAASVAGLAADDIEVRPPPTSLDPEPAEFLEHGDRIFVAVRVHARCRGSGVELRDEAFHVWTVEDERAVRFEVFVDRDEALAVLRS